MTVVTALGIQKDDFDQPLPLLWPREKPCWSGQKPDAVAVDLIILFKIQVVNSSLTQKNNFATNF